MHTDKQYANRLVRFVALVNYAADIARELVLKRAGKNMSEKKKRYRGSAPFIEVIRGETKSEAARKSMEEIIAKLENAKKQVKKRQELGF